MICTLLFTYVSCGGMWKNDSLCPFYRVRLNTVRLVTHNAPLLVFVCIFRHNRFGCRLLSCKCKACLDSAAAAITFNCFRLDAVCCWRNLRFLNKLERFYYGYSFNYWTASARKFKMAACHHSAICSYISYISYYHHHIILFFSTSFVQNVLLINC